MTEHSPGPWRIEHNEDADEIVIANFGGEIAVLHGVSLGEADEANARLNAAAPELLAALEAIRSLAIAAEYYSYGYDYDACVTDVRKRAEAAIAIAHGEHAEGMKARGGNDAE